MNDARLRGCDPDVGVEVEELEDDKHANQEEIVLSTEPTQVQDLVQHDRRLDQHQRKSCLFGLGPNSHIRYTW